MLFKAVKSCGLLTERALYKCMLLLLLLLVVVVVVVVVAAAAAVVVVVVYTGVAQYVMACRNMARRHGDAYRKCIFTFKDIS